MPILKLKRTWKVNTVLDSKANTEEELSTAQANCILILTAPQVVEHNLNTNSTFNEYIANKYKRHTEDKY